MHEPLGAPAPGAAASEPSPPSALSNTCYKWDIVPHAPRGALSESTGRDSTQGPSPPRLLNESILARDRGYAHHQTPFLRLESTIDLALLLILKLLRVQGPRAPRPQTRRQLVVLQRKPPRPRCYPRRRARRARARLSTRVTLMMLLQPRHIMSATSRQRRANAHRGPQTPPLRLPRKHLCPLRASERRTPHRPRQRRSATRSGSVSRPRNSVPSRLPPRLRSASGFRRTKSRRQARRPCPRSLRSCPRSFTPTKLRSASSGGRTSALARPCSAPARPGVSIRRTFVARLEQGHPLQVHEAAPHHRPAASSRAFGARTD